MTKVKRMGVLSLAKLQGITMALLGLFMGFIFALFGGIMSAANDSAMLGARFGVFAIIILPIIYGIMGFIGGALGAFIYNIAAKITGGIEIELEN